MLNPRVAWLVPAIQRGAAWQFVLSHFIEYIPDAVFYTGQVDSSYDSTQPGADRIEVVDDPSWLTINALPPRYRRHRLWVTLQIMTRLLAFKPDVVYSEGFSLWTVLVIVLKRVGRWRVVLIQGGSAPHRDFRLMQWRTLMRQLMLIGVDSVIVNSQLGRQYFIDVLNYPITKIRQRIYLVPHLSIQVRAGAAAAIAPPLPRTMARPIFLYVGQITPRQGLITLINACLLLQRGGYTHYAVSIIGTGKQQPELEQLVVQNGMAAQIYWQGGVAPEQLGAYLQQADVFVFPAYEDGWGMVVSEAMAFGKPVLCSTGAAVCELVQMGENGFRFDPHDPLELAAQMAYCLDHPEQLGAMGERSRQIIAPYTPQTAAQAFVEMTYQILEI